jgi:hypothetical protein
MVYPRALPCPLANTRNTRACSGDSSPRPLTKSTIDEHQWPFPAVSSLTARSCLLEPAAGTWLVGASGEWRKRQPKCLCKHPECPGVTQQNGLGYLLARLERMSSGLERFWDVRTNRELRIGEPAIDRKRGFLVGTSATSALTASKRLQCQHQAARKCKDWVVLRGCVYGCGCTRNEMLVVSSFRPVCAMDFVVTHY